MYLLTGFIVFLSLEMFKYFIFHVVEERLILYDLTILQAVKLWLFTVVARFVLFMYMSSSVTLLSLYQCFYLIFKLSQAIIWDLVFLTCLLVVQMLSKAIIREWFPVKYFLCFFSYSFQCNVLLFGVISGLYFQYISAIVMYTHPPHLHCHVLLKKMYCTFDHNPTVSPRM